MKTLTKILIAAMLLLAATTHAQKKRARNFAPLPVAVTSAQVTTMINAAIAPLQASNNAMAKKYSTDSLAWAKKFTAKDSEVANLNKNISNFSLQTKDLYVRVDTLNHRQKDAYASLSKMDTVLLIKMDSVTGILTKMDAAILMRMDSFTVTLHPNYFRAGADGKTVTIPLIDQIMTDQKTIFDKLKLLGIKL